MGSRARIICLWVIAVGVAVVNATTNNKEIQAKILHDLETFESTTQDKDHSFLIYTGLLRQSLTSRLESIEREFTQTSSALKEQSRRLRMMRLQLGLVMKTSDHLTTEAVMSGAANTLIECAHEKQMHYTDVLDTQHLRRFTDAAIAFAESMAAGTSIPHEAKCFSDVANFARSIQVQAEELMKADLRSFNETSQLCLSGQKRLVTESGWIDADEIPVLEDVLAMRTELNTLSDLTSDLQARLASLQQERDLKTRRLHSLDEETRNHHAIVARQRETMARVRVLMQGQAIASA